MEEKHKKSDVPVSVTSGTLDAIPAGVQEKCLKDPPPCSSAQRVSPPKITVRSAHSFPNRAKISGQFRQCAHTGTVTPNVTAGRPATSRVAKGLYTPLDETTTDDSSSPVVFPPELTLSEKLLKYFRAMIDVRDEDWLEYMRKLGFPETRLQEMYTSSSSEKKIDMLNEWLKIAGIVTAVLLSNTAAQLHILYLVTQEISRSRDANVDRRIKRFPHHVTISRGRVQAWFIYSLLEQYTDVDEWKEVVEKNLQIKATDATEIEEKFPNNFREQKYQIFHLFCRSNGLDTLDAMVARTREKGLKVPPASSYVTKATTVFSTKALPFCRPPPTYHSHSHPMALRNVNMNPNIGGGFLAAARKMSNIANSGPVVFLARPRLYSSTYASVSTSSAMDNTTPSVFTLPDFGSEHSVSSSCQRQSSPSIAEHSSPPSSPLSSLSSSSSLSNESETESDLADLATECDCAVSSEDIFEKSSINIWDSATTTAESTDCKDIEESQHAMNSMYINEASEIVGPCGAALTVGGCKLTIPEGALDVVVPICITSRYDRDAGENRATPLLKCEPHGLKFNKEVEVILPTCYLTDGSVPVTAKARRSEDGEIWKTIKSFDYRIERCFKFSISGFSWYDVILENLPSLAVEKLMVCCIPHKYSDDPKKLVIVCNIFDAVLKHKPQNCSDVLETSIALGRGEPDVSFQLVSNDISIAPEKREVKDARSALKKQAHFRLTKQDQTMLFEPITLKVTTAKASTEDEFYIFNCDLGTEENVARTIAQVHGPSDTRPKVAAQTVSGAVVGCEKVNYAPQYHYHYDGESPKQIAPPSRDSIGNGRVNDQMAGGPSDATGKSLVSSGSKKGLSLQVPLKPIENGQALPSSNARDISTCKSNGKHESAKQIAPPTRETIENGGEK